MSDLKESIGLQASARLVDASGDLADRNGGWLHMRQETAGDLAIQCPTTNGS